MQPCCLHSISWIPKYFSIFFKFQLKHSCFLSRKCNKKMSYSYTPNSHSYSGTNVLTHWGWDKMDAISQTTWSSAFSSMKMFEFRLKFHWSLFLRVQLTIIQHCIRERLGTVQVTSHYLNQWWLVHWRIYASLALNELTTITDCFPWIDPSHKSHNVLVPYPTIHHFVTYVCTFLLQSGAMWDIFLMHCGICEMGLFWQGRDHGHHLLAFSCTALGNPNPNCHEKCLCGKNFEQSANQLISKHIDIWLKWQTFCRQNFHIHYFVRKFLSFDEHFT